MRIRVLLGLCLPLMLVACGGGLLSPARSVPSPAAGGAFVPAQATHIAAPVPVASLGPSPTVAGAAPMTAANTPEIAGGLVTDDERERYVRLTDALRTRDEAAADWLVDTGLLLRDARLDGQELQILAMLLRTKGDPLWYVTHIRTLQGVDDQDVEYLASIVPNPSDHWYFDDDMRGLEAFELLSKDGQRSLQRVFDKARNDVEVRKGLYLINMLGMPDSRAFRYPVPGYNAQLYLLARLLEQGVPGEYERAAVAAALTYGSLMTLCEADAREQIVGYAAERVRFLIDCDVLLAAAGATWRSAGYTLEALMLVLWGGQAAAYPEAGRTPAQAQGLAHAAAQQPLKSADLDRLLVRIDVLREMQDEMMRAVIERSRSEARAGELVEEWWSANRREEADDGGPDLNRQWARWHEGRGFVGGTESAYVLQGLAASINLPLPWAQLWYAEGGALRVVPYGLRLDPGSETLRLGESALRATGRLAPETPAVLVWWREPWDNWRLPEGVRSALTLPLPLSVWRGGIPSGYLLRLGVAKEEEILSTLGVAATPTPPPTESQG